MPVPRSMGHLAALAPAKHLPAYYAREGPDFLLRQMHVHNVNQGQRCCPVTMQQPHGFKSSLACGSPLMLVAPGKTTLPSCREYLNHGLGS
jgi:hypothetical protein